METKIMEFCLVMQNCSRELFDKVYMKAIDIALSSGIKVVIIYGGFWYDEKDLFGTHGDIIFFPKDRPDLKKEALSVIKEKLQKKYPGNYDYYIEKKDCFLFLPPQWGKKMQMIILHSSLKS